MNGSKECGNSTNSLVQPWTVPELLLSSTVQEHNIISDVTCVAVRHAITVVYNLTNHYWQLLMETGAVFLSMFGEIHLGQAGGQRSWLMGSALSRLQALSRCDSLHLLIIVINPYDLHFKQL